MKYSSITVLTVIVTVFLIVTGVTIFLDNKTHSLAKSVNLEPLVYDAYLIEGVPFIDQETNFYCSYAANAMIFNYYNKNTSLSEILFSSGIGYSLFYQSSSGRSYQHMFRSGVFLCQNMSEQEFVASLFSLSYDYWYLENITTDIENWDEYWSNTKNYIINDIPVKTSVDPYSIPPLNKMYDSEDIHGGHAVVIVGFNESNSTVCYNDPQAGLWGEAKNGSYFYLSQEIFKGAVKNTTGLKYFLEFFINNSDSKPLTKEQRFQKAHDRNIKKMKGEIGIKPDLSKLFFANSGMKGLKLFKKDLRMGYFHRMRTVIIYSYYPANYVISIEKQNASQYLDEIKNSLDSPDLINICNYDSSLLQKEADQWNEINQYFSHIYDIGQENRFIITLLKSIPITSKIRTNVNELISLETQIIEGPNSKKLINTS